jgi:mannitol/fructose-specific phosphotransferase system IIA component (Ntr-type)
VERSSTSSAPAVWPPKARNAAAIATRPVSFVNIKIPLDWQSLHDDARVLTLLI